MPTGSKPLRWLIYVAVDGRSVAFFSHSDRKRRSSRLTATVPAALFQALEARSAEENRSLSNLVAHLLEAALNEQQAGH